MDRTEAYQFTVTSKDDERVKELKAGVAAINKLSRAEIRSTGESKPLYRVRFMPRGPRSGPARQDYSSPRAYDSYLPCRYANSLDVYIHRDYCAERSATREVETGLTPGQQRRVDREEHALVIAKVEMHQRLREAGIYLVDNEYVSKQKHTEHLINRGVPPHLIERLS